ncbi:MAG: DUF192 domain-containing protein [Bacillota bacterium]
MGRPAVLRITNNDTGMILAREAVPADTFSRRLRGLLGKRSLEKGREGLVLSPCRAVHTFGMLFCLDLLFLNVSGEVLQAICAFPPGRFSPFVNGARFVVELPEGMIDATQTSCGHRLIFSRMSKAVGADDPVRPE